MWSFVWVGVIILGMKLLYTSFRVYYERQEGAWEREVEIKDIKTGEDVNVTDGNRELFLGADKSNDLIRMRSSYKWKASKIAELEKYEKYLASQPEDAYGALNEQRDLFLSTVRDRLEQERQELKTILMEWERMEFEYRMRP